MDFDEKRSLCWAAVQLRELRKRVDAGTMDRYDALVRGSEALLGLLRYESMYDVVVVEAFYALVGFDAAAACARVGFEGAPKASSK